MVLPSALRDFTVSAENTKDISKQSQSKTTSEVSYKDKCTRTPGRERSQLAEGWGSSVVKV